MSSPPEAHSRKPDPAEPWRYVCPDCRQQVRATKHHRPDRFRCSGCGVLWPAADLFDQKRERQGVLP